MKINRVLFGFIMILLLVSCDKKPKIKPVSERIQKNYRVLSVTHDGTLVYSSSGTNNIVPEYSSFRMNLSTPGKVSFKDITPETFNGGYSVTDNSLTLTGLNPEPTGSNGTLSFNIDNISDDGTQLILSATKGNPKTGNTRNTYTLTSN